VSLDPIGPDNNEWIRTGTAIASIVLAAWGTDGEFLGRGTGHRLQP